MYSTALNHGAVLDHALSLNPGDAVHVEGAPSYTGPGIVSKRTHWDSHLVWLDHSGVNVAVEIPNGNVWLYPALTVSPAPRGAA